MSRPRAIRSPAAQPPAPTTPLPALVAGSPAPRAASGGRHHDPITSPRTPSRPWIAATGCRGASSLTCWGRGPPATWSAAGVARVLPVAFGAPPTPATGSVGWRCWRDRCLEHEGSAGPDEPAPASATCRRWRLRGDAAAVGRPGAAGMPSGPAGRRGGARASGSGAGRLGSPWNQFSDNSAGWSGHRNMPACSRPNPMPACDLSPKLRFHRPDAGCCGHGAGWRPVHAALADAPAFTTTVDAAPAGFVCVWRRQDCGSCHGMRLTGGLGRR